MPSFPYSLSHSHRFYAYRRQLETILPWLQCRLKALLYWLFGPKNQSFLNKSGKTQPIQTKFGKREQVKGWQRSGNFGRDWPILAKMGAGTTPAVSEFFCLVNHATFRELRNGRFSPNLVTKRSSVSRRWIRKDFRKCLLYGSFAPEIWHRN